MEYKNYPVQSLMIEKSKSTLGKYVIKVSEVRFEFFPSLAKADRWLLNAQIHGIPEMEPYQAYCD